MLTLTFHAATIEEAQQIIDAIFGVTAGKPAATKKPEPVASKPTPEPAPAPAAATADEPSLEVLAEKAKALITKGRKAALADLNARNGFKVSETPVGRRAEVLAELEKALA